MCILSGVFAFLLLLAIPIVAVACQGKDPEYSQFVYKDPRGAGYPSKSLLQVDYEARQYLQVAWYGRIDRGTRKRKHDFYASLPNTHIHNVYVYIFI